MKTQFARINGPIGHADVTYTKDKIIHILIFRGSQPEILPENPPLGLSLLIEFIKQFPKKSAKPLWPFLDLSPYTEFSKKILSEVFSIPKCTRRSYGEIAKRAGSPAAARAVGSVMRKNAFPLVIPCHRIIKSDGTLGAYCGVPENSLSDMRKELTKAEILRIEQEDQGFVLMHEEMRI